MVKRPTRVCQACNGTGRELHHGKVGAAYRRRRMKADLSLREVARRMGISAPYLSDLERGNRNWRTATMRAFERATR